MRIRALLFIPALAAAALAVGAGSASGATLFTTNNHAGMRVTVGATTVATSEGNVDITSPTQGLVGNRCSHVALHLRVSENTTARTSLDVTGSTFGTCDPFPYDGNHAVPWRLTILGHGTTVGGLRVYPSALHGVNFNITGIGVFSGNLTTGMTVTQSATTTNGICAVAAGAGTIVGPGGLAGFIDGRFCLTTAPGNAWSLT